MRWTVIIPVKGGATGKSRLLPADLELARAIALDTITAAASAESVELVLVPTSEPGLWDAVAGLGEQPSGAEVGVEAVVDARAEVGARAGARARARVEMVAEPQPRGIAAAIDSALQKADPRSPRAVLLGDLPALRASDLDDALALAGEHPAAFVPDHDGTGTTLVTALGGVPLLTAFGSGSAAAHRELGLVELSIPADSRLRHDVDTADQLAAAESLGLGPFTRAARDRQAP